MSNFTGWLTAKISVTSSLAGTSTWIDAVNKIKSDIPK